MCINILVTLNIIFTVQCTMYSVHCTLCSVHFTLADHHVYTV